MNPAWPLAHGDGCDHRICFPINHTNVTGTFIAHINSVGSPGLRKRPLGKDQAQENHTKEEAHHVHEQLSKSMEVSVCKSSISQGAASRRQQSKARARVRSEGLRAPGPPQVFVDFGYCAGNRSDLRIPEIRIVISIWPSRSPLLPFLTHRSQWTGLLDPGFLGPVIVGDPLRDLCSSSSTTQGLLIQFQFSSGSFL